MHLDFPFFSPIVARLSLWIALAGPFVAPCLVFSQSEEFEGGRNGTPAKGADSGASDPAPVETELYRQAVSRFKGPSRIYILNSENTSLETWTSPQMSVESSVILDWTDKELIVVRPEGVDKTSIPNANVVRIEPCWDNELAESFQADYLAGRFQEAISKGAKILGGGAEDSLPRWQQRVVIAELIDASVAEERWERAALLYLSLAKSQSPPLLLSVIPIPWSSSTVDVRDRKKLQVSANTWLQESREPLQLLAAAWLLDTEMRSEALKTLERLSRSADAYWVRKYAEAQIWRTVLPSELQSGKLPEWIASRDSMLLPFQAGPTMLIADKLSLSPDPSRALDDWMRVALLHQDRPPHFRKAKESAILLLESQGREAEAAIVREFGTTTSP